MDAVKIMKDIRDCIIRRGIISELDRWEIILGRTTHRCLERYYHNISGVIFTSPVLTLFGMDVVVSRAILPDNWAVHKKGNTSGSYGYNPFSYDDVKCDCSSFVVGRRNGRTADVIRKSLIDTTPPVKKSSIKDVIFNDPATIVMWKDGTKTVVKAEGEAFDPEKGLAMAISKKALGNQGNYYDVFKKWLPEEEEPDLSNTMAGKCDKIRSIIAAATYGLTGGLTTSNTGVSIHNDKGISSEDSVSTCKYDVDYLLDKALSLHIERKKALLNHQCAIQNHCEYCARLEVSSFACNHEHMNETKINEILKIMFNSSKHSLAQKKEWLRLVGVSDER